MAAYLLRILCVVLVLLASAPVYPRESKTTVHAAMGEDGIQRVAIVAGSYYFAPDHIVVKVNGPVELAVRKESGVVPHNIVVRAPEAGIAIEEGLSTDQKVIRFKPTKPGEYAMYCDKKLPMAASRREKGMEGVLEVVE